MDDCGGRPSLPAASPVPLGAEEKTVPDAIETFSVGPIEAAFPNVRGGHAK